MKIAPYTYKLNHPTFLYDDAGVSVIGIGYIRATITLAKGGKTYSGVSTFEGYDLAGNVLIPQSSAEVVGQRLTVDTTVGPLALGTNGNGSSVVAAAPGASALSVQLSAWVGGGWHSLRGSLPLLKRRTADS